MKRLIIASDNRNKIVEIKNLLKDLPFDIISKSEAGLSQLEIEETEDTLEGNALLKAREIAKRTDEAYIMSDDTGLFVNALNGEPGIYSSRYSGEDHNDEKNKEKLLKNLEGKSDRSAYFKTVIALRTPDNREYIIDGICEGAIEKIESGSGGFGYDPIFKPSSSDYTFAEMDMEIKNTISHRGIALKKLVEILEELS